MSAVILNIHCVVYATKRNASLQLGPRPTARPSKEKLIIGLILPYTLYCQDQCYIELNVEFPTSGSQYAAAFKIAVDEVNKNPTLLPNHEISFVYNNTNLYDNVSVKAMYWQVNSMNVTALIGLGWHCFPLASIATALNIPVISQVIIFTLRICSHCPKRMSKLAGKCVRPRLGLLRTTTITQYARNCYERAR